jgi:glycosyltransferase involved in cell wall biosynthesis
MNAPPVTVALITYNHEPFIADAVDSICRQTFGDFELLVVDDGSTDRTGEIVRSIRDARIVYVNQENAGPSEARNEALRRARGAIIAQMSGDDVAEPLRLERQLAQHCESPRRVVFTHCTPIDERGHPIASSWLARHINRPNWTPEATLRHLFLIGNCFCAPSAMASRAAFEDVGPYKATLLQSQDYDMWVRFLLKGYDAYIVQEPLLRYRMLPRRLSANLPATRARMYFERRRILREFATIASAAHLARIFPELEDCGYPLDDDLVPFLVAMVALGHAGRTRALEQFAGDVLMDQMELPERRRVLAEKAGFRSRDLFRILGGIRPPGERDPLSRSFRAYVKRVKEWAAADN